MLNDAGLGHDLWDEAAQTYVYLRNRVTHKGINAIPEHVWTGKHINVRHLRIFGCRAWAKTHTQRGKLDPKAQPRIFIGYDVQHKAWRLLDPATGQVQAT